MKSVSSNRFSELFRNRAFMVLWANQFCLQLSYSMINFSMILWVYELTGKNTAVSMLILFIIIPSVFLGTFAGVTADNINRKYIIQATDVLLAVLFFAFLFVNQSIAMIYFLAFTVSVISQFFLPAEGASIPTVVPKQLLAKANSLFSVTIYASLIVGYTLAGPLISLSGTYVTPFITAGIITTFASVLFVLFPDLGRPIGDALRPATYTQAFRKSVQEVKEGIEYIFRNKGILISILLLTGVQTFVSALSVLIPEYIDKILSIRATYASYIIMLPLGLGLITGAFFNGAYARLISRRKLVEFSIIGVSIMLLALASAPVISEMLAQRVLSHNIPFRRPLDHIIGLSGLLVIFSYFLGFFNVSIVIPSQTVLQEMTPESMRGRVFGVLNMMMSSIALLPVVLIGPLADTFGTVTLISVIALCVMSVGLFVQSKRFVTEKLMLKKKS